MSWITVPAMALLATHMNAVTANSRIWPENIPSFQHVSKHGISQRQAEYLVALAARHEKIPVKARYSAIFRNTYTDPAIFPPEGYFYFSLGFANHSGLLINYRNAYYIDRLTGDILTEQSAMNTPCLRVTFPALVKLQSKIMAATGATVRSEAAQQHTLECIVDE